jgi:3-oxoadipate enol-lactonase
MPFATASDGIRLYYETVGDGEPLLLISGQTYDHTAWDEAREDFSDRYRVIVYDHRGTGASDKPRQPPYSTRGFAQDAVAILDDLGIERAHAYGVSMGGRIGQWLGIEHGRRVGSLVLGCTTPGNAHGVRRSAEADAIMASGDPARLLDLLVSREWLMSHPEFARKRAEAAGHPIPPYAQQLHYRASEAHDAWDLLPTIRSPTLVIHGSEDAVNVPANAPLLAQRIPGAELHVIPGARHAYFWDHRRESAAVVRAFLARHPLSNGTRPTARS